MSLRSAVRFAFSLVLTAWTSVFLTTLLAAAPAWAAEDEDATKEASETERDEADPKLADRIRAVERKLFIKGGRFELQPFVGLDLNDAFFQHFFVGAGAAYHLEDAFSLELRGGFSLGEVEKNSVRFLRTETGSLLESPPELVAHADMNFLWAPVYGKLSLFGESILHFDTFLAGGLGIFVSQVADRATPNDPLEEETNINPAFNLGIGQRYFLNEWLVLRLELRNYSYLESGSSDLRNVTLFTLGVSGFFPTTFEYKNP